MSFFMKKSETKFLLYISHCLRCSDEEFYRIFSNLLCINLDDKKKKHCNESYINKFIEYFQKRIPSELIIQYHNIKEVWLWHCIMLPIKRSLVQRVLSMKYLLLPRICHHRYELNAFTFAPLYCNLYLNSPHSFQYAIRNIEGEYFIERIPLLVTIF